MHALRRFSFRISPIASMVDWNGPESKSCSTCFCQNVLIQNDIVLSCQQVFTKLVYWEGLLAKLLGGSSGVESVQGNCYSTRLNERAREILY